MTDRSATARAFPPEAGDPREQRGSAEIIDLATRHVLPAVARAPRRRDAFGTIGAVAVVALIGAVTFWNLVHSRQQSAAPAATPATVPATAQPATSPPMPAIPAGAITPLPMQTTPMPHGQTTTQTGVNPLASPALVYDSAALPEAARAGETTLAAAPASTAAP